ncbi:hypothetical protein JR316_0007624 [Psilocybe cubensis]|uniref:Uncharacterized protein n=1 Tax=Psilocybe cubensis TaxID=181762 RepID=A0ACB8GTY0_PSICU|nr:hypothetical protein JR316_0007624 [Psilocybe cubensis]KAH9479049.1 hypothetical protein JR316_0007624 [Psilocybe cubensis]
MPPAPWAVPDQIEFMSTRLPQFQDAQRNKTIAEFWVKLYAEFFLRWKGPEDEVQPNSVQPKKRKKDNQKLPQTSTPIELDHAAWIKLRKTQIANWFNNRGKGSENRRQGPAIVIGSAGPSQRALSELNVYSKRYYNEKIRSRVEKELKKHSGPAHIALINKCISEAWDMESKDVKEEIRAETKRLKVLLKEDRSENTEQPTPQEYAKAIMEAPGQITSFLQEMYKRTGWCLSVIAGGPDPSRQGKIRTISIHMGKDKFDQFYFYLYNVYSQTDRDNRALSGTKPIASMKMGEGGIMDDCEDDSGATSQMEVEAPTIEGEEDGAKLTAPDGQNDMPAVATGATMFSGSMTRESCHGAAPTPDSNSTSQMEVEAPTIVGKEDGAKLTAPDGQNNTPTVATEATVFSGSMTTESCYGTAPTPAMDALQNSVTGPDKSLPVSLLGNPLNGMEMDGEKLYEEEDRVLSFMELLKEDGGYDPQRDSMLQISMNNGFFSDYQFWGNTQENRTFQVPTTEMPMAWVSGHKANASLNVQAPLDAFPTIPMSANNPNGHGPSFYHQEGPITPTAGSQLLAQPAVMCAPYIVQPAMLPTTSNQSYAHSNTSSAIPLPAPQQLMSSALMNHQLGPESQNPPSLRFSDVPAMGMPHAGYLLASMGYTNPAIFSQLVQATPNPYGSGHHNTTIPQIVQGQAHVGVNASGAAQEPRTSAATSHPELTASLHPPQTRPSTSEKQQGNPVTGAHPASCDTVSKESNCTTAAGTMIVPSPSVAQALKPPILNVMNADMQLDIVDDGGRRARKAATSRNVPMQQMWRAAALEHLMMPEIDTEKWKLCVKAWVAFEDSQCDAIETSLLRFPAATRPVALTKWLSTRKYGNAPDVGVKFGDEWVTWWNNSQPKWRQSSEAGKLPQCLSVAGGKDSINVLKKGGPNGLVTVMIGLRWWAKHRHSDPRWEEAVEDILAVFQAFQEVAKVTKKRKGNEQNIKVKSNVKRKKT